MKHLFVSILALMAAMSASAKSITVMVTTTKYQTVTGFGAACCDGAMCPFGTDTTPVKQLYGSSSKIGLNIMRMEISPNFKGNLTAADPGIGWDTPYDWEGSVPSAQIVKARGGIVFGTPWSPPGEYKTNGTAQGGNSDKQGNQRGELRKDCYEKFFPWFNTFLAYMKSRAVKVDAVSVQNEPDWWVDYSGCLYTPQQQLELVKNYAHLLDREKYPGVRLISAEPLGFDPSYSDALLKDAKARDQIDIIAGHLYGHPPMGNMMKANTLASKYKKEVWMTEHSVTDYLQDRLPNWNEQLEFARELSECMQSGCTGYIYWYMRAHWAFVGTGESKYGSANKKNQLLPRAYVMSHFSKHVTGSTRLRTVATGYTTPATGDDFQATSYIKGDSLIVMLINSKAEEHSVKFRLPYYVNGGTLVLSTGNESTQLCQTSPLEIAEPVSELTLPVSASSVSTFIFNIDREATDIRDLLNEIDETPAANYDLLGRQVAAPKGLHIQKYSDGTVRKVFKK